MKLVIIGNGVAGVTTARLVAERDRSVDITVCSEESYFYYPRPRLHALIAGTISERGIIAYPEEWYKRRDICTTRGRRVARIDPKAHLVVLDDGTSIEYDRLVLATGAHSFIPPIPGVESHGVFTLRSLRDALAIREEAGRARRALIVGGGLLGLELSVALLAHGLETRVVELMPWLLPRQLDAEGADLLQQHIESKGVQIITGERCTAIEGLIRVGRVRLQGGRVIDTDMVIISAGVRPNLELAQAAGLDTRRGVVVDERMRTSLPDVYAVGDVAEFHEELWSIIPAAVAQARVAAAQVVGDTRTIYAGIVPSTTLKVTGVHVTSAGEANPVGNDHTSVRYIDASRRVYKKLVIRDGHIVGGIALGDGAGARAISQLVTHRARVSTHMASLVSEGFDPGRLVSASASSQELPGHS